MKLWLSILLTLAAGALIFPVPAKPGNPLVAQGNVMTTGMPGAVLSSLSAVFARPSLASDELAARPSVRGVAKTTSEARRKGDLFGLQAMILGDDRGTPADADIWRIDLWRNPDGTAGVVPYDWQLRTSSKLFSWDFKSAIPGCSGTGCPDLDPRAGTPPQGEASQPEDSSSEEDSTTTSPARTGRSPSTETGWLEITYDPSSTSVGAPTLGGASTLTLLCNNRLLATPSSILVACEAANTGMTGTLGMSFQHSTLEGAIDSSGWHVSLDVGSGLHVAVASSLPDPLSAFGIDKTWGIDVKTREGLIGTPASLEVLKQATTPNLPIGDFFAGVTSQGPASGFFVGITSQGPAAGAQFTSGPFGASAVALFSGGQVQAAGALTLRAGDLSFGYTVGPDGPGLVGRLTRDPLDLTVFLTSADTQVGLSYTPQGGPTLQASWSGAKGFEIALAVQFKINLGGTNRSPKREPSENDSFVELPFGGGNLVITPPSPWDGPLPPSVNLSLPLPAPSPARPATSSP
jgi:hypothetical protein